MLTTDRAVNLVLIVALAAALLGVVSNNLPIIGSFRYIWGPGAALLLLMIKPTLLFSSPLRSLLVYGIVVIFLLPRLLWLQMDEWNRSSQLEEFISLLFAFIVISYFLKTKNMKGLSVAGRYGFAFIIISVIISHFVLFIDGSIIRDSAAVFNEDQSRLLLAERTGAIGYGYAQGIIFLFPLLIYAFKNKLRIFGNNKVTLFIILIMLLLSVRAQVFSNLLVSIVLLSLALIGSKKTYLTYTIISVLLIIVIFVPVEFYANILKESSQLFETNSNTYVKLNDFADFLLNPDTDREGLSTSHRASRYPMLFESLLQNPLFGTFSSYKSTYLTEGAHLYFMNRLTVWGIPVFLFFIYILFQLIRKIRSLFDAEFKYYYFLSIVGFILLGLSKNIAGREPFIILFIIIPGLYFLIRRKNPKYFKKTLRSHEAK